MSFLEVLLIGVGLSMDAFAVALCKGLSMKIFNLRNGLIIAFFFGGFQALMPLLGWILGTSFEQYITSFDHWIAFGLLLILGGKMVIDAIKESRNPEKKEEEFKLKIGELVILSVATSIDALAIGITFACLAVSAVTSTPDNINFWFSILTIGLTTFVLSLFAVAIGNKVGEKFQYKAEIFGGVILILLGVKILLEHLGVIAF